MPQGRTIRGALLFLYASHPIPVPFPPRTRPPLKHVDFPQAINFFFSSDPQIFLKRKKSRPQEGTAALPAGLKKRTRRPESGRFRTSCPPTPSARSHPSSFRKNNPDRHTGRHALPQSASLRPFLPRPRASDGPTPPVHIFPGLQRFFHSFIVFLRIKPTQNEKARTI